jgi:hypothetical protein
MTLPPLFVRFWGSEIKTSVPVNPDSALKPAANFSTTSSPYGPPAPSASLYKKSIDSRHNYRLLKQTCSKTNQFRILSIELRDTGVTVTMVAPDFVVSEMHRRALGGDGKPLGKSPMQEEKIMTAEKCATLIVKAIENRERLLVTSFRGKLGRWVKMFAPGMIDKVAAKAIQKKK